jgi:hypothetical protein
MTTIPEIDNSNEVLIPYSSSKKENVRRASFQKTALQSRVDQLKTFSSLKEAAAAAFKFKAVQKNRHQHEQATPIIRNRKQLVSSLPVKIPLSNNKNIEEEWRERPQVLVTRIQAAFRGYIFRQRALLLWTQPPRRRCARAPGSKPASSLRQQQQQQHQRGVSEITMGDDFITEISGDYLSDSCPRTDLLLNDDDDDDGDEDEGCLYDYDNAMMRNSPPNSLFEELVGPTNSNFSNSFSSLFSTDSSLLDVAVKMPPRPNNNNNNIYKPTNQQHFDMGAVALSCSPSKDVAQTSDEHTAKTYEMGQDSFSSLLSTDTSGSIDIPVRAPTRKLSASPTREGAASAIHAPYPANTAAARRNYDLFELF